MKTRSRTLLAATLGAAAMAALGSIGWAAIPGGNGVINGCYEKRTGILRLIDAEAGKSCLSFETPISWNQKGEPGEAGPQGPEGPQGPPGDAGGGLPTSEPWHLVGAQDEPPFLNGWANIGGQEARAAFYRDSLGIVRLKGAVFQQQPSARIVFVLPEAYRPNEILKLATAGGGLGAGVAILPDGAVFALGPSQVNLEGTAFRAEQ